MGLIKQTSFLEQIPGPRPWKLPSGVSDGFEALQLFMGRGRNPLEVAVASASRRPNQNQLRSLWSRRHSNRPSPLLLVVLYSYSGGQEAAVCGPTGDHPPVMLALDRGFVERMAEAALEEPDRHAAIRFLQAALPESDSDLPGIRNEGLLASHELCVGVPDRADWAEVCETGAALLDKRGRALIEGLGFSVEARGTGTYVLRTSGAARAIAVFLDEREVPDRASNRYSGVSPVAHALATADMESLPYAFLTRGNQIRIYAVENVGVGRKGRSETFVEANLALIPDDRAGYLPLLFGAQALEPGGSFEDILERSRDFATDLGDRLRDRIYKDVVPILVRAVVSHQPRDFIPNRENLDFLYKETLTVLFRLLFIAYAEDKDLLPYRSNDRYRHHALKAVARELADRASRNEEVFDASATDYWMNLKQLFEAVERGNSDWGVPCYDGGLFSQDPKVSRVGSALVDLEFTNAELGPALTALLVDRVESGLRGPVDFRSLSAREFGTIYEGLLESSLSAATTPLTVDSDGNYVPADPNAPVEVEAGEVYLHNRSGARKASGSYFTKPFAVEHLLEQALEPALSRHLDRLEKLVQGGEEEKAAEAFFDFRCVDIAMGSGHFLVAVVDRIEARFSTFLAKHPLAGVVRELELLKKGAQEALGVAAEGVEIEATTLLRRQIARRCIYGVDKNEVAVELARLSIWLHTFVPGLPLSFLNHNLVCGDSLTGIGSLEEAVDILDPASAVSDGREQLRIYHDQITEWLAEAEDSLRHLAHLAETTVSEIEKARKAHREALDAIEPARNLFDLLLPVRLGQVPPLHDVSGAAITGHKSLSQAQSFAAQLKALHFPIAFPDVFLRENPGFDCIVGNPPWEKVKVEKHGFWALRFPGIRGLPVAKQNALIKQYRYERPDLVEEYEREVRQTESLRAILVSGPYPGMGSGDPDLYKAFAWRFWQLCRAEGTIGVVLPRSALMTSGSARWRETILEEGTFLDVTTLLNRGGWLFEDVHQQYTIGLVTMQKSRGEDGKLSFRGPHASYESYLKGMPLESPEFPVEEFVTWSTGAAFPLLPKPHSADVFLKLRRHPRFDNRDREWAARPVRELDATNDKEHMILKPESTDGLWPVYKGASFDIWRSETGEIYAWADTEHVSEVLQTRRLRQNRLARSAFSEFSQEWARDPSTLPCNFARVAFRDVTRATDSRTVRAALVPPRTLLNHKAPYLLWSQGDERDQTYLLGILASIPLDWYARRFVEVSVTFELLASFPIPRAGRDEVIRKKLEIVAGRLAAVDERYEPWAKVVGVPVASVADDEHEELIFELDAIVARLYGLDEADVTHIFSTFHEGWDFGDRLDRVLAHFKRLPA